MKLPAGTLMLLQSVKVALDMLRLHKLRAFLTMFGVIIGVMAVTITVMISNGFQAYMTNQFSKIGAKTITAIYMPSGRNRGQTVGNIDALRNEDIPMLMARCSSLKIISPYIETPAKQAVYGDKNFEGPKIEGGNTDSVELNNFETEAGRFYNKDEVDNRANVVVIGTEVRDKLFAKQNPIGEMVTINGTALTVIGVAKSQTVFGQSNGKVCYVPYTTVQSKWTGGSKLSYIQAVPKDGVDPEVAKDELWVALMIKSDNKPVWRVDTLDSIVSVFNGLIGAAGIVLSGIAALSLLVGGIGIMNIMLVSVTERTKEIGLRKALGARRSSILGQFVVESATLSLVGGLIGMAIAYGLGTVVTMITISMKWPNEGGLPTPFPMTAAFGAMIFSALIGVVFGLYPAISASRLDPIVAFATRVNRFIRTEDRPVEAVDLSVFGPLVLPLPHR